MYNFYRYISIYIRACKDLYTIARFESILLFAVLIIQGIIPALILFFIKEIINSMQANNYSILYTLISWWIFFMIIDTILSSTNQLLQGNVGEKFTYKINNLLVGKNDSILGIDIMENSDFYNDINLLREGARSRGINFVVLSVNLIRDIISVMGIGLVMAESAWWIPLAAILGAIPHTKAMLELREMGWNALMGQTPEARRMEYQTELALSFRHAMEVKLFSLSDLFLSKYSSYFDVLHRRMRGIRKIQAIKILPYSFISTLVTTSILLWIIYSVSKGNILIGGMASIIYGLYQIQNQIFSISENSGWLYERLLYFQKLYRFLDSESLIQNPTNGKKINGAIQSIEFRDIEFQYPDGRIVLSGISFNISYQEKVAIVGENGAGKTTIIKLILRLYDPTKGVILINGIDLRELDLYDWRRKISAVFQDFGKYSYTALENITLSDTMKQDKGNQDLFRAISISDWDEIQDLLPHGISTQLGKEFDGTELSGGQWQKLAIARSVYRDASILLLDEPTSALDPRSEFEFIEKLKQISEGKTTLFITHRLSTAAISDKILVFKGGKLIESGRHDALLKHQGYYNMLWQMQSQQYLNNTEEIHYE